MATPTRSSDATSSADRLNILLIGGGGREHALAQSISRSPRLATLYATHTSNPGIAALARPVDVPVSIREIYRLRQFIEKHTIGLVVIGPEDPLSEGYADKLASPTCTVFGPTQDGARLESDKAWCKQLLRSASVPTPDARVFTDAEAAKVYLESREHDDPAIGPVIDASKEYSDPKLRRAFIDRSLAKDRALAAAYDAPRADLPVIKASGLARGKGVILPATLREALLAIDQIMIKRVFGDAGAKVLIEERITGTEVSVLAITDGSTLLVLPPAQDHKRLGDGDTGPNTGGMGAFCPAHTIDDETMRTIEREVLVPTLDALRRDGIRYVGVLYAGLMLTHTGPRVLEYNCRFGDPECQAILPRLESDIVELMLRACHGTLDQARVLWKDEACCTVVLASAGYPDAPRAGEVISGIEEAEALEGVQVFHAGTNRDPSGRIVTAGGRVLSVSALGASLELARTRAYQACEKISFTGKVMRSDIGAAVGETTSRRKGSMQRS